MPPRYAYWTILIDNRPTAFRARDKEELLPTLYQLKRKNADVVMKWFARGRLWDTPEQAQWAGKSLEGTREKRGRDWRPGGQHKDPRARFDKRKKKPDVVQVFRPARRPDVGQVFRPADGKRREAKGSKPGGRAKPGDRKRWSDRGPQFRQRPEKPHKRRQEAAPEPVVPPKRDEQE